MPDRPPGTIELLYDLRRKLDHIEEAVLGLRQQLDAVANIVGRLHCGEPAPAAGPGQAWLPTPNEKGEYHYPDGSRIDPSNNCHGMFVPIRPPGFPYFFRDSGALYDILRCTTAIKAARVLFDAGLGPARAWPSRVERGTWGEAEGVETEGVRR